MEERIKFKEVYLLLLICFPLFCYSQNNDLPEGSLIKGMELPTIGQPTIVNGRMQYPVLNDYSYEKIKSTENEVNTLLEIRDKERETAAYVTEFFNSAAEPKKVSFQEYKPTSSNNYYTNSSKSSYKQYTYGRDYSSNNNDMLIITFLIIITTLIPIILYFIYKRYKVSLSIPPEKKLEKEMKMKIENRAIYIYRNQSVDIDDMNIKALILTNAIFSAEDFYAKRHMSISQKFGLDNETTLSVIKSSGKFIFNKLIER